MNGRLTLTLRIGEIAVIEVDGKEIEIKYARAIGRQKGVVQIAAPREFPVNRRPENKNDRPRDVTFSE